MPLTPQDFVSKWKRAEARERQSVQEHFLDLCQLVGHDSPMQSDPKGTRFAFEMGAAKTSGGTGWADVAKLGYFGWEYKSKDADLDKAYEQLLRYRDALQNPPLLIVSDINNIIIRTNYTNLPTRAIALTLDDLLTPEGLKTLKAVFFHPDELKPRVTIESVTQEAAQKFSALANVLRKYGENPQEVAHFLIRLLFCLFAEDIGLLPNKLFPRLLEQTHRNSKDFAEVLRQLFRAMNTGGYFGADKILHFNGGLFDDDRVLQLDGDAMDIIAGIDALDWSAIQPSIFGTLFERGLDPAKRSQLGAHYTGEDDILLIVEPVLMEPLRREWEGVKVECQKLQVEGQGKDAKKKGKAMQEIGKRLRAFADKIAAVRVLDPACGSGNFLYVALRLLLDLQNEVISFSDEMGAGRFFITVSPSQLFGIETNEYAHELAQITIWIGYIQWLSENGYGQPAEPILKQMKNILRMDAILEASEVTAEVTVTSQVTVTSDAREPEWPAADVIIGNPPFLGGSKLRRELGDKYTEDLWKIYEGRVPGFADLVCYWFEKARAMIEDGKVKRAGLLATQGIRGGANRKVLERIKETGDIFWAQSDRNWILNGATVHVSMIGFDAGKEIQKLLDNKVVEDINPDLSFATNATQAKILEENARISFKGPSPAGGFDIEFALAKKMLSLPNPNGKSNSDVIRPVVSATDLVQQSRNLWTIDFGLMPKEEAALYEAPFEYLRKVVYPVRSKNRRAAYAEKWWQYSEARPGMREALIGKTRFIATPRTAKHRVFVWLTPEVLANDGTIVFAREDDYFFGILHSRIHELWARRTGTQLREAESGFRYTSTSTFETFPFPWAPSKEPKKDPRVKAISQAAKKLVELRDRWLNPAVEVTVTSQVTVTSTGSKRTLTNLYNERPTWLELAHKKLDEAVFAAYGWKSDLSNEEILERLLALNLERSRSIK
ncbi:MAG: class I SAM-dependent DNA methyltransferase [Chloroflexi bacterium]|nr:class I SAM-dependent DNA methyltransferase [Chloroflexota bacterium]